MLNIQGELLLNFILETLLNHKAITVFKNNLDILKKKTIFYFHQNNVSPLPLISKII